MSVYVQSIYTELFEFTFTLKIPLRFICHIYVSIIKSKKYGVFTLNILNNLATYILAKQMQNDQPKWREMVNKSCENDKRSFDVCSIN